MNARQLVVLQCYGYIETAGSHHLLCALSSIVPPCSERGMLLYISYNVILPYTYLFHIIALHTM